MRVTIAPLVVLALSLGCGVAPGPASGAADPGAAPSPGAAPRDGSDNRRDVWIVAVGVSRYPKLGPEYQLDYADDDARGVAASFASFAGPSATYRKAHVTTLVDDDVSAASVASALDALAKMRPDDLAVVFLAGHGAKPTANEDMVLLTAESDGSPEGDRRSGIGWSQIGARIGAARGKVVVLLDACHSGHITQEVVVPNEALVSALASAQRAGVMVFAAAKGSQLSYEPSGPRAVHRTKVRPAGRAGQHGFFTGALLDSLSSRSTDRDRDGTIQLSELVEAVSLRVAKTSEGLQTPWVARNELFGDFGVVSTSE